MVALYASGLQSNSQVVEMRSAISLSYPGCAWRRVGGQNTAICRTGRWLGQPLDGYVLYYFRFLSSTNVLVLCTVFLLPNRFDGLLCLRRPCATSWNVWVYPRLLHLHSESVAMLNLLLPIDRPFTIHPLHPFSSLFGMAPYQAPHHTLGHPALVALKSAVLELESP